MWSRDQVVILDLQAVQNRDYAERGIARHASEFALALCEAYPDIVGGLLLNPDLPDPGGIESLVSTGKVGYAGDVDLGVGGIYHVIAPFEFEVALDRLWPSAAIRRGLRLVVTLHDLIPRLFPDHYHSDPGLRRRYLAREELVRAADRVLSVSQATRDAAVGLMGIDPRRIRVIGAGISREFHRPDSRDEAFARARRALPALEPGFLFSVGGIDHRKNVEALLGAYALLPEALQAAHQLVIAFRIPTDQRSRLEALARRLGVASRLYLTGYIDDPTLIAAYQSTALFVFPSLYEGYGLPVVEAMACGALVVSSGASSLGELTPPIAQFDPADAASIAKVVGRALTDPATAAALAQASLRPPPIWRQAVDRAVVAYEELLSAGVRRGPRGRRRMRVGLIAPKCAAGGLVEVISVGGEVDVFDETQASEAAEPPVSPLRHLGRIEAARGGYQQVVYAFGSDWLPAAALDLARRRPGIVVALDHLPAPVRDELQACSKAYVTASELKAKNGGMLLLGFLNA